MHQLILLAFIVATTFEYLGQIGVLPVQARYVNEILATFVVLYVVVAGTQSRFRNVRAAYWLTFGALLLSITCGALINEVDPGPLFAGVRAYLWAIPYFFLPAVVEIRDTRLKQQFQLLIAICLVQVPIAVDQRMSKLAIGSSSGDATSGTMLISSILSVFLIGAACLLVAALARKRIGVTAFLVLFFLIILPTTINETKATLVLLPLGILIVLVAESKRGQRFRNALVATLVIASFGAVFVPIYDYLMMPRWGYGIVDYFTMEGRVEGYLKKEGADVGSTKEAGRIDTVVVPFRSLAADPLSLVFGVGMGNASESALGIQFSGRYAAKYAAFTYTSAAKFLLELGLFGATLVCIVMILIVRDANRVFQVDTGLLGVLALGWIGVAVIVFLGLFYKDLHIYASLSMPFWYFSGVIAAARMRLADVPVDIRRSGNDAR